MHINSYQTNLILVCADEMQLFIWSSDLINVKFLNTALGEKNYYTIILNI
jgi:hypothetical protein